MLKMKMLVGGLWNAVVSLILAWKLDEEETFICYINIIACEEAGGMVQHLWSR